MSDRTYLVVPFERQGTTVGPRHAFAFAAAAQARAVAHQLAARVPGIAIVERVPDPETGDERDTLLAGIGMVPPSFPDGYDWTVRLN